MDEAPQQPLEPQAPASQQPLPAAFTEPPKNHHWWIVGGVLGVALIVGIAGAYYFSQNNISSSSAELVVSTTTSQTAGTITPILNLEGKETNFSTDGKQVYYTWREPVVIPGADPETFEWIDYDYAKDKNNVYAIGLFSSRVEIIEDADPATFVSLGGGTDSSMFYGRDVNRVYFRGEAIEGADPTTFTLSGYDAIYDAEDKNNKYVKGDIIDLASFQIISTQDGKNSDYAKDTGQVYFKRFGQPKYSVISGDPENFSLLGNGSSGYSRDGANVYFLEKAGLVVSGADPSTFVSFDPYYYGKDKNRVYRLNDPINFDPSTFVALDYTYVKDVNKVCYLTIEPESTVCSILNADPATFMLVEGQATYDAQDKNHKYKYGKIVE